MAVLTVSTAAEASPEVLVDTAQVAAVGQLVGALQQDAPPTAAAWDDPLFWNVEQPAAARCQYLAVGNAMNFRFWSLIDGRVVAAQGSVEGEKYRGSMYLWRRLRRAVDRGQLSLDAGHLGALTMDQLEMAFRDDAGAFPLAPGAEERLANLQDLGRRLASDWEGQFRNVVVAAGPSLELFGRLSACFRAFDDPLRKLTMVNAIMLCGSGLASFDDDPLPAIDYHLVKQALRQGLVRPPAPLRTKLVEGELLDAVESVALRTATLDALVQVATRAGMSTSVLDNLYWLNRTVCSEDTPACRIDGDVVCPFAEVCTKQTDYGLPLELTRYY